MGQAIQELTQLVRALEAAAKDEAATRHKSATAYLGVARSDLMEAITRLCTGGGPKGSPGSGWSFRRQGDAIEVRSPKGSAVVVRADEASERGVASAVLFELCEGLLSQDDGVDAGVDGTRSQSAEDVASLRAALAWYAAGEHFTRSDPDAWDTVSGEPQNWWCDVAGTATVEDGSLAQMVLDGKITGQRLHELQDGEEALCGDPSAAG